MVFSAGAEASVSSIVESVTHAVQVFERGKCRGGVWKATTGCCWCVIVLMVVKITLARAFIKGLRSGFSRIGTTRDKTSTFKNTLLKILNFFIF